MIKNWCSAVRGGSEYHLSFPAESATHFTQRWHVIFPYDVYYFTTCHRHWRSLVVPAVVHAWERGLLRGGCGSGMVFHGGSRGFFRPKRNLSSNFGGCFSFLIRFSVGIFHSIRFCGLWFCFWGVQDGTIFFWRTMEGLGSKKKHQTGKIPRKKRCTRPWERPHIPETVNGTQFESLIFLKLSQVGYGPVPWRGFPWSHRKKDPTTRFISDGYFWEAKKLGRHFSW